METIEVKRLELWARHGVMEHERVVGNMFTVDVSRSVDLQRAMVSDSVEDTVNYAEVVDVVKAEMAIPSLLLENVVWRVKNAILARFPMVRGGSVKVAKLTPPVSCNVDEVSVTTRW